MSEELDVLVLELLNRMIDGHSQDALLVNKLWKDRTTLVAALEEIRDWDLGHSEARSLERVDLIISNVLAEL